MRIEDYTETLRGHRVLHLASTSPPQRNLQGESRSPLTRERGNSPDDRRTRARIALRSPQGLSVAN